MLEIEQSIVIGCKNKDCLKSYVDSSKVSIKESDLPCFLGNSLTYVDLMKMVGEKPSLLKTLLENCAQQGRIEAILGIEAEEL